MKRLLISKILIVFLLFLISPVYAFTGTFHANTVWIPNPSWLGGLNTRITLGEWNGGFYFDYIKLQNLSFYASVNNHGYWLNVTSGLNLNIVLLDWFHYNITSFTTDKACNITLYVNDKGEPSWVSGANYTYNDSSKTLDLIVSGASYVEIHWGIAVSLILSNPDVLSWRYPSDNATTIYGRCVLKGVGTYGFQIRVYVKNDRSDVSQITLTLGDKVKFRYDDSNHRLYKIYDPYDLCEIATEHYPEGGYGSWYDYDAETKKFIIGFNVHFKQIGANKTVPAYWFIKYTPYMFNENATVTINSPIEGTLNYHFDNVFFVGVSELAFVQPVQIAWDLSFIMIGLGGMFMLIFAPLFAVYKIKHGEYVEGLGWGLVLMIIAIGLIIVWLWK